MADVLGKEGYVHRVTEQGDVRVQFHISHEQNHGEQGSSSPSTVVLSPSTTSTSSPTSSSPSLAQQNRWTFHPGALSKIPSFSIGDQVMICSDEQRLRQLQKGHGEWSHEMINVLGKQGGVLQVYADGDIRVKINGQSFTFNPQCCFPTKCHSTPIHSSSFLNSTSHNTLQAYQAQQQMEYASSIDWSFPGVAAGASSIAGGTTHSSSCTQMLIYNTLLAHNDALSS